MALFPAEATGLQVGVEHRLDIRACVFIPEPLYPLIGNLQKTLVGYIQMIAIQAVLDLHLPVTVKGVTGHARDQFHAIHRLIHQQVDKLAHIAQVLFQGGYIGLDTAKDPAPIFCDFRHWLEAKVERFEGVAISGVFVVLNRNIFAVIVEYPAVVATGMEFSVALAG